MKTGGTPIYGNPHISILSMGMFPDFSTSNLENQQDRFHQNGAVNGFSSPGKMNLNERKHADYGYSNTQTCSNGSARMVKINLTLSLRVLLEWKPPYNCGVVTFFFIDSLSLKVPKFHWPWSQFLLVLSVWINRWFRCLYKGFKLKH